MDLTTFEEIHFLRNGWVQGQFREMRVRVRVRVRVRLHCLTGNEELAGPYKILSILLIETLMPLSLQLESEG